MGTAIDRGCSWSYFRGRSHIAFLRTQGRLHHIEIKTFQLLSKPQVHRVSCDKNQLISSINFHNNIESSAEMEEQLIIAVQG